MATSAEQIRAYSGPALLSYGFRPFFLAGALWSAAAVAIWLPLLAGVIALPTHFSALDWHTHEMIYGYVPAVVAGFLLTAVPNWTGRLPVIGWRLGGLFGLWCAGRFAVLTSAWLGAPLAATVDAAFLAVLAAVIGREIVAGNNTRNLKVLAAVCVMFAGNVVFHVEASTGSGAGYGLRLGVAAAVMLIQMIGGRVIPSFTHNWLARREIGRLPAKLDKFDIAVLGVSGVALAAWVVAPSVGATSFGVTGWLALAAGLLNAVRLARWAGERTAAEPLVFVLHAAFAFVPAGFFLLALAMMAPGLLAASAALHAWTAGAIGTMTLAIMTRASLGHTGRALTATPSIQAIYVAVVVSAVTRIAAGFGWQREALLDLSALAWVLAFAGFAVVYAPMLSRPRS